MRKGKDSELAKWDEELRKSLANKKAAGSVTLTKQQQALVNAQLEIESRTRQQVNLVKAHLERGLYLVRSLVAANVPEFSLHISSVASLLLEGALTKGNVLVGPSAFETYLVSRALVYRGTYANVTR